jgi:hypothetical protein
VSEEARWKGIEPTNPVSVEPRAFHAQPINTNERIAARHRNAAKLSAYLARAIPHFVGHPAPEAYAF